MAIYRVAPALLALAFVVGGVRAEDGANGKLVFDVKPFTTEIELKPKIENQLKAGGIEWGMSGNQLVVTLVNKQFLRAEISNFTRYGEQKTLDLPPGDYTLTCVGFVPETAFSVEKMLSKAAFFNLDRLAFQVAADDTTVLELHPVMRKHSNLMTKFFQPDILVKVVRNGETVAEAVINTRTAESIAWDDYSGPLKYEGK